MMRDGIVHNDGAELAVGPTVPAAMSVDVGTGMALVQGRYLINDADLTLTVEAADPSYARIDRVIVRADLVGRTVHCVVKKGTPATSPVAPTLTRTAETWELSLAQVAVGAGATSIIADNITDERGNVSLCGVAAPVYVPSSQLEVVGAVDMQSNALTGLPVPSAATSAARRDMGGVTLQNLGAPVNANDAARKAYVDSAVGGFGISQVAIDADKNWNGKSITNVGQVSGATIEGATVIGGFRAREFATTDGSTVVKSNTLSQSYFAPDSVKTILTSTMPAGMQAGSIIRCWLSKGNGYSQTYGHGIRVLKNDDIIYDSTTVTETTVSVVAGDVVTLQAHKDNSNYNSFNITGQIRIGSYNPIVNVVTPQW
jgi:hypothetical protein